MITVYKYRLPIEDVVEVEMPVGAEILKVGVQEQFPPSPDPFMMPGDYENVYLWAKVDTEVDIETRKFRIVGTGHLLYNRGKYVAKKEEVGPLVVGPGKTSPVYAGKADLVYPKYLYLDSVFLAEGRLVFHIFEILEE